MTPRPIRCWPSATGRRGARVSGRTSRGVTRMRSRKAIAAAQPAMPLYGSQAARRVPQQPEPGCPSTFNGRKSLFAGDAQAGD